MRAVFFNQQANASLNASFVQPEILFRRGESLQRARRRCAQFTDDTDRQAGEDEAQVLLILWRRLCRRCRPRPQPPPNHIQHITAIAQWNSAEQGEITEDERLALDRTAHGQVLKHLGDCADSVVGSVGEDVEWRLGVDEQGGHIGAVAGQCWSMPGSGCRDGGLVFRRVGRDVLISF